MKTRRTSKIAAGTVIFLALALACGKSESTSSGGDGDGDDSASGGGSNAETGGASGDGDGFTGGTSNTPTGGSGSGGNQPGSGGAASGGTGGVSLGEGGLGGNAGEALTLQELCESTCHLLAPCQDADENECVSQCPLYVLEAIPPGCQDSYRTFNECFRENYDCQRGAPECTDPLTEYVQCTIDAAPFNRLQGAPQP